MIYRCSVDDLSMIQPCYSHVPGCFRSVLGVFQGCSRHDMGMFSGCSRRVLGLFQGCFRDVLGLFFEIFIFGGPGPRKIQIYVWFVFFYFWVFVFFLKGQRWPADGVSQRGFVLKWLTKMETNMETSAYSPDMGTALHTSSDLVKPKRDILKKNAHQSQ